MNPKIIFLTVFIAAIIIAPATYAQFGEIFKKTTDGVLQKAKTKAEAKAEQKRDEALDKIIDAPEAAIKKNREKKKTKKEEAEAGKTYDSQSDNATATTQTQNNQTNGAVPASFSNTGDFVPGKEVIAFDDFMQDNPGDLPAKWSSTGGCEIAQLKNNPAHWVQMTGYEVFFLPQYVANMPANCTIEFDMVLTHNANSNWFQEFMIELVSLTKKEGRMKSITGENLTGLSITLAPKNGEVRTVNYVAGEKGDVESSTKSSLLIKQQKVRVSIMRQEKRIKMYLDNKKIIDLSEALPEAKNYALRFQSFVQDEGDAATTKMYITNLRYAKAGADTRSKLLTEGKLVTNAILFDVNKSNIKPGSEAILEEVGTALQQTPGIRIRITGHTDSDGGPEKNLKLSRDRANAVKVYLVKKYGLNEDNIVTADKGQSEPVADNKTATGKAQNRRVEFTKL